MTLKNRSEGATALLGIADFVVRAHTEVDREIWLEVETTLDLVGCDGFVDLD